MGLKGYACFAELVVANRLHVSGAKLRDHFTGMNTKAHICSTSIKESLQKPACVLKTSQMLDEGVFWASLLY